MLRFSDVESFLTEGLSGLGYGKINPADGTNPRTMPVFSPGPASVPRLAKLSPGSTLFVTVGNGVGLDVQQLFDRPFITVRAIGPQRDYEGAETLAYDVDQLMLAIGSNATIGTAKVLYITRTGGAPTLIDYDAGDRHHFQTIYITEAQTGY